MLTRLGNIFIVVKPLPFHKVASIYNKYKFPRTLSVYNMEESNKRTIEESELTDQVDLGEKEIIGNIKEEPVLKKIKIKSHKFALLLSYCGMGYFGLQRNPPHPTVEEELLLALKKCNIISEEEYNKPQLLYFQRAARTDKGVSAAKQILSLRLPQTIEQNIPDINKVMPEKVKLISAKRATKYFDSKNFCDARTYAYMMPTYALCSPTSPTNVEYRITKEKVEEFNSVLAYYKGTHNYHNFTSQKEASDASAQRYIIFMESGEPFMKDGMEFIIVRIKGQSFMLHQIRKMIGLAIAIMRGFATAETLKGAFNPIRIDIPKAPGLGLMLEEVHYDKYNKRFGGDGHHEPLIWSDSSKIINDFKDNYIYPIMVDTEKTEHTVLNWLATLPLHTYSVRDQGHNHLRNIRLDKIETKEESIVTDDLTSNVTPLETDSITSNEKPLDTDSLTSDDSKFKIELKAEVL